MSAIEFRAVTKRYPDGTQAVTSLSLRIEDGEVMALVWPSGCGKSTALRMIAGLEEVTEGEVLIGEEVVNRRAPKDRDVAMVFQSYALYPHMTVRQNIAFALRTSKLDKRTRAAKIEEVARILELEDHLDRKPSNLSGGQRQRVAMGRAMVRDPRAFLMDEPLSNLDAKLRVEMRLEVSQLQRRLGTTMIYVTHDQTEAMTIGDRIAVMQSGVMQQVGAPKELYESPATIFVAGFVGSPSMNFLPATVDGDRLRLPIGEVPLLDHHRRALAAGAGASRLVCGIRPEHFEDAELVTAEQREHGAFLEVLVDTTEALGADTFVYFQSSSPAHGRDLDELAADPETANLSAASGRIAARLSAQTRITAGRRCRLWMDPSQIHLFDGDTGMALASAA